MEKEETTAQRIDELAELYGILPGYWDIFGTWHATTPEAKRKILAAMRLGVESGPDIEREIHEARTRQWRSFLEPVHVISEEEQPFSIPLFIPVSRGGLDRLSISCMIEDEAGNVSEFSNAGDFFEVTEEKVIEGRPYVRTVLTGRVRRNIGYYTLTATAKGLSEAPGTLQKKARVIIAPEVCYLPAGPDGQRLWGLSVNLYALRSARNWGVGDFADLRELCRHVADLNGSFVGLNPLHAIPNTAPYGLSPYSPISRMYRNVVYLDVEAVVDVTESEAAGEILRSESFRAELNDLRNSASVDYGRSASLKLRVLRCAFDHFHAHHYIPGTARAKQFRAFLSSEDENLRLFGLYLSLRRHFIRTAHVYAWQEWPEAYRSPGSDAVTQYRECHERDILFHCYIQWLIEEQLTDVQNFCFSSGMKVGLYHDLAVGAIGGGSDIWMYQDVASGADVGAPPDDFSPNGQSWGFPALIPERMRESGYELFIQTLRQNMKYGGALRIDHALGLFRVFWVPGGMSPKDGGYVLQPSLDLLRIIALESQRNRTIVIAEDLGTIDEQFREMLIGFRMLSYRLLYFERNYPDPSFKTPERYASMALCAVTTHDLPTLYGYWEGHDIEMKSRLGIYRDDRARDNDRAARERDRRLLLAALKAEGLLTDDFPDDPARVPHMTPQLCSAIYRYLAKSSCRLVLASLDDIIGTLEQQNMPGTVDQHPNWMQKTPLALEEIVKDGRFLDLSKIFRDSGRC